MPLSGSEFAVVIVAPIWEQARWIWVAVFCRAEVLRQTQVHHSFIAFLRPSLISPTPGSWFHICLGQLRSRFRLMCCSWSLLSLPRSRHSWLSKCRAGWHVHVSALFFRIVYFGECPQSLRCLRLSNLSWWNQNQWTWSFSRFEKPPRCSKHLGLNNIDCSSDF